MSRLRICLQTLTSDVCREILVGDIVRCCSLTRAAAAVDAALQCVIQMCCAPDLQVTDTYNTHSTDN